MLSKRTSSSFSSLEVRHMRGVVGASFVGASFVTLCLYSDPFVSISTLASQCVCCSEGARL